MAMIDFEDRMPAAPLGRGAHLVVGFAVATSPNGAGTSLLSFGTATWTLLAPWIAQFGR